MAKPFDTPREQYVAIYAVSVSDSFNTIPEELENPEPKIRSENWESGDVAEILHIDPYEKEIPTIDKLK
jgi:hypothetical protein